MKQEYRDAVHNGLVASGNSGPNSDDIDAFIAALADAGLAIVPVEPTEAMLNGPSGDASPTRKLLWKAAWKAMLSAAQEDQS